MDSRRGLLLSVGLLLLGGVLVLAGASQPWLRLTQHRALPLPPLTATVAGHTVSPVVPGLAVVALAGAVALLATAGLVRIGVGVALAVVGAALSWRSATGASVSDGRARELLASRHTAAVLDPTAVPSIHHVPGWPLLSLVGGLLVLGGGLIVVALSRHWAGMSSRYEAPSAQGRGTVASPGTADPRAGAEDDDQARARADVALWRSVDLGEDPTLD